MLERFLHLLRRRPKRQSRRRPLRERFQVGRETYGEPRVLSWHGGSTLDIGAFCSIAAEVAILTGGEHRTAWITTYPLPISATAHGKPPNTRRRRAT
jgi:chloramphenicol O-acetyltransferase type B